MPPPRELIERRKKIVLEAASRLFLAHGFAKVSIDMVVGEVGGSKGFIYNNFGSKGALFIAAIQELCQSIAEPLLKLDTTGVGCEAGLRAIALRFLDFNLSSRSLALHRLVIAERQTFPQIGQVFMDAGPRTSYAAVADFMRRQQDAGNLNRAAESIELATIFLGMLNAGFHMGSLLAGEEKPAGKRMEERADHVIHLFMAGAGPDVQSRPHVSAHA